jgi:hypothetical protein
MGNALIKRTRAKRAIVEARGAVGRLLDAAEALEQSKARGEVTSRAKWLLTALGKLEVALQEEAGGEIEEARRRRAVEEGRPEATARMEEAARIVGDGDEADEAPFPHYNEHDDSAYQCGKDRDDRD